MSAVSETNATNSWGRVDETNTVYVREADGERQVGQYPDGTAEEALAYFERKFQDLAGQVTLLEQRLKRGTAAADLAPAITKLQQALVSPNAVGDIAALRARVSNIESAAGELAAQHRQEQEAQRADALAVREGIVARVEVLAGQDLSNVQWKQVSAELDTLFTEWQEQQKTGPKLPKSEADALWKRFRNARSTIETARRTFFAELDSQNREVKRKKEELITRAEALADQGQDGIPAYRELLDRWKQIGRAGRKLDDQLWARFKAAGDVLFEAKAAIDAQTDEEFAGNLAAKEALLKEAAAILTVTDHVAARQALAAIQLKWDEIGKVPRDAIKRIDQSLREIEDHVKQLEEQHWRENNPETKARAAGLRGQLEASIEALAAEHAAASSAGDTAAIARLEQALATQRSWLAAID